MHTSEKEIKELLRSTNRVGVESLIQYMELNNFFTAFCSRFHHLACKYGLAIHSLSITKFAIHLKLKYDLPISINSIIICGICHDLCKLWEINHKTKRHGEASRLIVQTFITLTEQEKEMIQWHMGPYSEYYDRHEPGDFLAWSADKNNANRNAALLMYFCDHFSTMFLEV